MPIPLPGMPPVMPGMIPPGMIPSPSMAVAATTTGITIPQVAGNHPTPPLPPQAAFAAYQNQGPDSKEGANKEEPPPEAETSGQSKSLGGAKTRIVCPDELISLVRIVFLIQ